MIRMIQSKDSGHAKSYFTDALSKSDYYINDQELAGKIEGKLAERLGITGTATKDIFHALCDNINPATGKPLTLRDREDRTVGYDINFHCPKSVSLVHALSNDDHILKAFEASVSETMRDIEADSMTRVRKKGAQSDRATGNLVYAGFTHQTARPLKDMAPDCHLHRHVFVFNCSYDEVEGQIKAGQFRDIKRDMPYYQAMFQKRLADKLEDLGYGITRTSKAFEITGVPKSAIKLMSKRTDEIGRIAKEKGIADPKKLAELGALTRGKKQSGLTMDELRTEWRKQLKEEIQKSGGDVDAPIRFAPKKDLGKSEAKECLAHSLQHSFERASVLQDRRVLQEAYKHSVGRRGTSIEDIAEEFKKDDRIIRVEENNKTLCTMKVVLREEQEMVQLARNEQNRFRPLYKEAPATWLEGQQSRAHEHLLTTTNGVCIVRGAAGAGKTTLMKEVERGINDAGKQLLIVAPTSDASKNVLAKEGFTFTATVAKLIDDKKLQQTLKGQVLAVDEAGLLSTPDMVSLLKISKEQDCRLILIGDTRQHSSVKRGDALRILNTVAHIPVAEVDKIRRQRNGDYLKAVQDLANGDTLGGFEKLDNIGAIKEVDPLKPNDQLVEDYIKTVKDGKSALVVSPTRDQGETVTTEIRKELKAAGVIGKKDHAAIGLRDKQLTEAEKADARHYEPDQIIQFNQNLRGIKRGSTWTVKQVEGGRVLIFSANNEKTFLPKNKAAAFTVYDPKPLLLAKGDKVRLTKNTFDLQKKRLNNGQYLEVVTVGSNGSVTLINKESKVKYQLPSLNTHLDHAYCSTSHSSQGKTVDEIFISQPSSTFVATTAKQFYVSVSRGRDKCNIYTDDKEALLEYAKRAGDRQSATELVRSAPSHQDFVVQQERVKTDPQLDRLLQKEINSPQIDRYIDYEP